MSDLRAWLAARQPAAPAHLLGRLELVERNGVPRHEALAEAARVALDRARSAPGRVRESAFHLLAADALLTYACEAALEDQAPDEVLEALVHEAAAPR